ncbi:unnamed protein product [Knipowitschia caucasica]
MGEETLLHCSPWSCLDSLTQTSTHPCSEHVEPKEKESGFSGGEKPRLQSTDHYHGPKDEDPPLPVCEEPIVDEERLREPQPEPELDLCAQDMEDPEQDLQEQDSDLEQPSPLSQDLLLSPSCPSPLLASQTKETQTDQKLEIFT